MTLSCTRLFIAAGAVAVTLAGCGMGTNDSSPPPPTTTTVSQGESVVDGGLTFTVTNTWQQNFIGDRSEPSRYHQPRGVWQIVQMHIENNSDKSQNYDSVYQTLIIDGKKYSPDILASDDVSRNTRGSASLNPGFHDDFEVAFDIPWKYKDNLGNAEVEIHGDMMSPGAIVKLTGTVAGTHGAP